MSKQNATITIIVTSEEGQQVKRELLGTNKEIAFILGEFGILCKEECKILNVKENQANIETYLFLNNEF